MASMAAGSCVGGEDLEPGAEQIHEISAGPGASIEHPHARRDPPAQQLIEEIDVDLAEGGLEVEHDAGRKGEGWKGGR